MGARVVVWDQETTETLRRLAGDGLSSTQIAEQIPGATRSGIIGACRRKGISLTGQAAKLASAARARSQASRPKPQGFPKSVAPVVKLPPAPIPEPESLNLTLDEKPSGGCSFPTTGHDAPANGHRFCGAPRAPERPYCAHHHRIATGGLPVKKKPALSVGR